MAANKKFELVILEHFCKGCGLCVEFCEQHKLTLSKKPNKRGIQVAQVDGQADCTGCLQCATICPDAAIQIGRVDVPAGGNEEAQ